MNTNSTVNHERPEASDRSNDSDASDQSNDSEQSNLREADILVIHDSNGNDLDPEILHPGKKVLKRRRYTLDKAKSEVPKVKDPKNVKDVVFLVGLNDTKDTKDKCPTAEEIFQKHKKTCDEYTKVFENAELHIGAVAPVTKKQIDLNNKLRGYAKSNNISFIDNQELVDQNANKPKSGVLNGVHYTDRAFRTYAKSIRRSIYSKAHNRNLSSSQTIRTHRPNTAESPQSESTLMTAISELTKATHAILQKVGAQS